MKIIRSLRLLLASLMTAAIVAAPAVSDARTKVLQPVFLIKVANASADQTLTALRRALAGRHWVITTATPDSIEAKVNVRDHSITTRFTWTATEVAITYVASENMDYEVDGDKTYIDRYYYRWLKFIKRDVINFSKRPEMGAVTAGGNDDADTDDDHEAPAGK